MKKYLIPIAVATVLSALASCTKDDGKKKNSSFKDPEYTEVAKKFTFETSDKLRTADFTESGYAIVIGSDDVLSKALGSNEKVLVSKYTFKDDVYTVADLGTFSVNGNKVSFNFGTTSGELTAKVTPGNTATGDLKKLARAWKVKTTIVSVSGGTLAKPFGKKYNGCNLDEIVVDAKNYGVKVTNDIKGYNVKNVIFTQAGTVTFIFADAKPYTGDFNLSNGNFSYSLVTEGNDLINATGKGTAKFVDATCELKIDGSFVNGNDNYTTKLEFTLIPE